MGGRRRVAAAAGFVLAAATLVLVFELLTEHGPPRATPTPPGIGPTTDPLAEFTRTTIFVSGESWDVVVATEDPDRARGLMFVTDLGGLDGMLFVWESDATTEFWMKDTVLALDIAFFAADGTLVDLFPMDPCPGDPCPYYTASGPYRFALEAPRGAFDAMDQPFLEVGG